jgi:hypothetical protein
LDKQGTHNCTCQNNEEETEVENKEEEEKCVQKGSGDVGRKGNKR